ncbi:hypothetical protein K3152_09335 [Qipengyuania sp. 1NDH17]|uniref:Uncharacterized protein n=1 Tax=Qipengyuania polymorpha TaxID=2867234 RepID=A0ABS7IY10_9SPHN|nr:hypothetical protein [Qipengyuania polymorpha]MBX7458447.1 hypothetical protein [Qipengyuania polymorpha]
MKALLAPLALIAIAPAALAQEGPPAAPQPAEEAEALPQLTAEQEASFRCAMTFALVSGWQKGGDERGAAWEDMEANGGKEFFVRTMASLMDDHGLTRPQVMRLIANGMEDMQERMLEDVELRMPACLLMKQASGL